MTVRPPIAPALAATVFLTFLAVAAAADYSISVLDEPPPESLAPEIAKQLSPTGYKVMRGETSTLCHIWLCKQWPVKPDFTSTAGWIYPFHEGQLIGAIEYKRRGEDFREQRIERGVYTLRYALQPVDGNHVGTSPTRDFLLLVKAEEDKSPEPIDAKKLEAASKEAVQTSHPGMLALKASEPAKADQPSVRQQADDEWWLIRVTGTAQAGEKASPLTIDVVIDGHAAE